ncbi:hypothetical protein PSTH1771_00205 [Pseudomonas syringae pv. theae]|uniref:AbiTii domain-containing protein n=1 Tax=Pseudomonas syringae TaxID=317 RepID=UPI0023D4DF24|nr:hypothetical protein [Pseudomonas syringae]GKS03379.1 hypothetical protein PSTH1771_00205 [Pseudomonas syringae pv. theae]
MDSLVLGLQKDVLDRSIHITDLLRKALLVSRKLKIKDIESWLNSELNGYTDKEIPDYRVAYGELKAFNPCRGWIPVQVGDGWDKSILQQNIYLSVSQIENLADKSEGGTFVIKFPANQANIIMAVIGQRFEPALYVPVHQLIKIIDTTKTKILEFSLDLEEKDILGDGIVFSKDEQIKAQTVNYNTINIHTMKNSTIQQDIDGIIE